MSCFAFMVRDGRGERVTIEQATAVTDASFTWVHLDAQDEASRLWLREQPGIHDIVANALLATETRPRLEAVADGALINLRGLAAEPKAGDDSLVSIRLWAEDRRVVSLSLRPLAAMDLLCDRVAKGGVLDPGDLIAGLVSEITLALDPAVAELGDMLDTCEADLDIRRAFGMRREIAKARARAIDFRRFVVPQRQAVERLAQLDANWLQDDDRLHLREAADRVARMGEELESVRERAALLHEQITDLRAEQIDDRALLLSVVALVFLPLTFLTGLLGMNVGGIPFAQDPYGFWWVCGICLAIALVIGGFFARAHWLKQ